MPSKKQRRRREKSLRHEYDLVLLDEDGNETSLDPEERRLAREAKEKQRPAAKSSAGKGRAASAKGAKGSKAARPLRVPPVPSWQRALKRGGIMGGLMLLAFVFFFKNGSLGGRVAIGLVYAVAFVPLTYWIDRTAYRSYEKRLAKTSRS